MQNESCQSKGDCRNNKITFDLQVTLMKLVVNLISFEEAE